MLQGPMRVAGAGSSKGSQAKAHNTYMFLSPRVRPIYTHAAPPNNALSPRVRPVVTQNSPPNQKRKRTATYHSSSRLIGTHLLSGHFGLPWPAEVGSEDRGTARRRIRAACGRARIAGRVAGDPPASGGTKGRGCQSIGVRFSKHGSGVSSRGF